MMKTWSFQDETHLLKAVAKNKPLGARKNANISLIVKIINASVSSPVTKKDVIEKLETLYDLQGLEELESTPEGASEEKEVDNGLDKSDSDGASEDEGDEDDKQETKRNILTRSSTRRKSSEPESIPEPEPEPEKPVRVRRSTRNKSNASTPAKSGDPESPKEEPEQEKEVEEVKTKEESDDESKDNVKGKKEKQLEEEGRVQKVKEEEKEEESEEKASEKTESSSSSDNEHEIPPSEVKRKRTRSTALTPSMKLLKQSVAATPLSSRRSTRFGPAVEATPSKPAKRLSTRKTLTKPLVAAPATPGNNVVNTPSNNRRRSMRKK